MIVGYIGRADYSKKEMFLKLLAMHSSTLSDGIGVGTVSGNEIITYRSNKETFYELMLSDDKLFDNIKKSEIVLVKQRKNTSGTLEDIQPIKCKFSNSKKTILVSNEGTLVGYEDSKAKNDTHAIARVLAGNKSLRKLIDNTNGDNAIVYYDSNSKEKNLKVYITLNELEEASINLYTLTIEGNTFICSDSKAISLLAKINYSPEESLNHVQKLKGDILYTIYPNKITENSLKDYDVETVEVFPKKKSIANVIKTKLMYRDKFGSPIHTKYVRLPDGEFIYSSSHLWTEAGLELCKIDNKYYTNESSKLEYYRGKVVEVYFYNGLIIKSKGAFEKLVSSRGDNYENLNILNKYVKYPIDPSHYEDEKDKLYYFPGNKRTKLFTGKLNPIFTNQTIRFENGVVTGVLNAGKYNKIPEEFYLFKEKKIEV